MNTTIILLAINIKESYEWIQLHILFDKDFDMFWFLQDLLVQQNKKV